MDLPIDNEWSNWPQVPTEQQPKRLPHAGLIGLDGEATLISKGWQPVDVRLMPNSSDADRFEAVKAWLEGIRLGTIEMDPRNIKFLELEVRTVGKDPSTKAVEEDPAGTLAEVLSFGTTSKWATPVDKKPKKVPKKRAGRRKGSRDTVKRA